MENELSSFLKRATHDISCVTTEMQLTSLHLSFFGKNGVFTKLAKQITTLSISERPKMGSQLNIIKKTLLVELEKKRQILTKQKEKAEIDVTIPGTPPSLGHLHLVSQAIAEITQIFERIGFTRVRYPEIEWDWYAFESLNMPPNHPARDEWETFFVESEKRKAENGKFSQVVLTPHTSNGQVREMEKGKLPIRMINIAKCYRRQSDISHVAMFHQFEGLYVDKNVSIGDLKGFIEYFVREYFGKERKFRLRPFHFQFTEPSFEVDISCDMCKGHGCRLCKEGWLELAGCGMVHPTVLRNGGIDPKEYSGFAIGWGVERTYMMRAGTKLDDIRLLYSNDIRFLEQF